MLQKTGNSGFSAASSNKFRGKWRIPRRGVKIRVTQNTVLVINLSSD